MPGDGDDSSEDAADIFDTSLSALFAVPPIAFSTASPDAPHVWTPPAAARDATPVALRLPQPPAALHTALQANHVWLAGVYLADRLSTGAIRLSPPSGPGSARRARVAELGAAAGLPGIVACRLGADVVGTDWDAAEVLAVLRANFAANVPGAGEPGRWAVTGHCWGSEPAPVLSALSAGAGAGAPFDALILADTLWATDAHAALLDSVCRLAPGGVAHVAAGLHTGRGPVERFLARARERGLAAEQVDEVRWKVGGGWEPHVPELHGLEEERGVVVYYTLRIPDA